MNKYNIYIELLLKYNRIHKLTGAKTKEDVLFHIKDSLFPFEKLTDIKKVLDIGTGAGFPGMILAIEYPQTEFILVEPLQKRVAFLYLVKSAYGLKNVTIIQDRIEDIEPFEVDLITSKAVSSADALMELSKDFYHKDLMFLLYKGEKVHDETKNLENYEIIQNGKANYLLIRI